LLSIEKNIIMKIKYKYSGYIVSTLLAAGLFLLPQSCKKNLTREPLGSYTLENFYKTDQDCLTALIGAYSNLQRNGSWGMLIFDHGEGMTDNIGRLCRDCSSGYDNSSTMLQFNIQTSDIGPTRAWDANYNGIYKINLLLIKLPSAVMAAPVRERLTSEAKFLRALFYFDLIKFFGDVPLVLEAETQSSLDNPLSPAPLTRTPKAQVYAQIEKDLISAAAGLPDVNQAGLPSQERGRATKWSAQGLLSKVYLFQKKWADAKIASDLVIASQKYILNPDYRDNFIESGENGPESLFEVQFSSAGGAWSASNEGTMGSDLRPGYFGGINNAAGNQKLFDAFEPGDKRRPNTILIAGDFLKGSGTVPAGSAPYGIAKGWGTNNTNNDEDNANLPVLRYADVLLINAEANIELNNLADAKVQIDAVRDRAGLEPVASTLTQAEMRDFLHHERRVELAFEGHRLYDMVRWGEYVDHTVTGGPRAGTVIQVLKGLEGMQRADNFVKGKHEVLPIPITQIDLSKGLLIQNNGY
jgi:starch-binding outer membrane protein, SusD/RagB family